MSVTEMASWQGGVFILLTELFTVLGADLTCSYSGDYGANARVEWKFKDLKGSQTYVVFDGKPTSKYTDMSSLVYQSMLQINLLTIVFETPSL